MEHNEKWETAKGIIGFIFGFTAHWMEFLGESVQLLSGVGGFILVVLTIRFKLLQYRNEKNKNK